MTAKEALLAIAARALAIRSGEVAKNPSQTTKLLSAKKEGPKPLPFCSINRPPQSDEELVLFLRKLEEEYPLEVQILQQQVDGISTSQIREQLGFSRYLVIEKQGKRES